MVVTAVWRGEAPTSAATRAPASAYRRLSCMTTRTESTAASAPGAPASSAARRAASAMRATGERASSGGTFWVTWPPPMTTGVRGSRATSET